MSTHQGAMSTPRGVLGPPSTSMGRISVVALLVGTALAVLLSTVFESVSVSIGNLNVAGAGTFLVFLAAAVTGAIALIRDRERSWVVWLATVLPALLIGFEVLSLLIPGE